MNTSFTFTLLELCFPHNKMSDNTKMIHKVTAQTVTSAKFAVMYSTTTVPTVLFMTKVSINVIVENNYCTGKEIIGRFDTLAMGSCNYQYLLD